MVAGKITCDRISFSVALSDLKKVLEPINKHLELRNFLVGHSMTLADALLVSVLQECFTTVLDKKERDSKMQSLSRYCTLILKMAPCVRVFGAVTFCAKTQMPDFNAAAAPKKDAAAAESKPA